jgi:hypothetical protein
MSGTNVFAIACVVATLVVVGGVSFINAQPSTRPVPYTGQPLFKSNTVACTSATALDQYTEASTRKDTRGMDTLQTERRCIVPKAGIEVSVLGPSVRSMSGHIPHRTSPSNCGLTAKQSRGCSVMPRTPHSGSRRGSCRLP